MKPAFLQRIRENAANAVLAKLNQIDSQLMRIEEDLGDGARYAGRKAFVR